MERPRASCPADGCPPKRSRPGRVETVHSGQFMRSSARTGPGGDEDDASPVDDEDSCGSVVGSCCHRPWLDVVSGDDLDVLVGRISSTYCARFSSPRWSDFKGVGLRWHDKVRMNNLMWREWHAQFISKRTSSFCHFTCPLDDPIHRKPLAVVLEGKYWKKKLDAVTGEYKRRRVYWRARQRWKRRHSDGSQTDSLDGMVSERGSIGSSQSSRVDDQGGECPMDSLDGKVSERGSIGSSQSSRVDDPRSETSNSEDRSCCGTIADAFFASLVQSAWVPSQRREPDERHGSACLGSASDQDLYAVTLIEDFLRNGEMDWRSDHVPDDPTVSLQDAIDIFAAEASQKQEPTLEPSTSTWRTEPALRHEFPSDGCRNAVDRAVDQDACFSETACKSTEPQHDAVPAVSVNSTQAPSEPASVALGCDLDVLRQIVPSLASSNPRKLTKVAMLEGAAEYCRELRKDNRQLDDQISMLKLQIELLKRDAVTVQKQIVSKDTLHENLRREMFDAWVRARSSHNCKFPVFALLLAPLYTSFMSSVSSSEDQLDRTVVDWQQQHCSLATFRQSVLAALTVSGAALKGDQQLAGRLPTPFSLVNERGDCSAPSCSSVHC